MDNIEENLFQLYSPEELAESFVFKMKETKKSKMEFKKARLKKLEETTEEEKAYAKTLQIRFILEDSTDKKIF